MTPDQYRLEGARAMQEAASTWKGPGETPHRYSPDYMAQGDCKICGHTREAHQSAPAPVARLVEAHMPRAWVDVMGERVRQMAVEGWTPEHDDCHDRAELAQAAACYAISGTPADEAVFIHGRWKDPRDLFWPRGFGLEWWKPTNRRRDLVKAGALILAEIERLDRAAAMEADHD